MARRERTLFLLLVVTVAVAWWSSAGFPSGVEPVPLPAAALPPTLPCPPGFEPRAEARRLPDVPPGALRLAAPESDRACVALAADASD